MSSVMKELTMEPGAADCGVLLHCEKLALANQWKEAFDVLASYITSCASLGLSEIQHQQLHNLATILSKNQTHHTSTSFHEHVKNDWRSCSKCAGVLHQAVTLSCGHTYCGKCYTSWCGLHSCTKCGARPVGTGEGLKNNVTILNLVNKWWGGELKAVELKNEGNRKFLEGCYDEALDKYNAAVLLAPEDFTLYSNRSNVFMKMGNYEAALKDADQVTSLRPDWPKGHFRRADALRSLGRYDDALIALLSCSAWEKTLHLDICDDISSVLLVIMTVAAKQSNNHLLLKQMKNSDLSCGSEDSTSSIEDLKSESNLKKIQIYSYPKLHKLIDKIHRELNRCEEVEINPAFRTVDGSSVDSSDFECTLCCRLLWQPVTTPCGHSFCRTCLDRCMDHNPSCPLCKTSLEEFLASRKQCSTEFLDVAMSTHLPEQYAERSRLHVDEMKELSSTNKVPIFICTLAFPTIQCPLHVFEPRYRLMIRRAMESGSRQFGMCGYFQDMPHEFADYGTMLEVSSVEFFADGRSVVNTVGGRRFKVLHRTMTDGYYTADVEFLVDEPVDDHRVAATTSLHDQVYQAAQNWISEAPDELRQRIQQHFGAMPVVETNWISLPNGPSWLWWLLTILPLEPKAQLKILSMTSIEKRLAAFERIVARVRQRT